MTSTLEPNQAFKTLVQDPDWTFKVGVGGIFNALSFIVLWGGMMMLPISFCCWALTTGYVLRVLRTKSKEPGGKLPDWNEWLDLFVSGMSWLAIAYGFVTLCVLFFASSMTTVISYYSQLARKMPKTQEVLQSMQSTHSEQVYWMGGVIVVLIVMALLLHLFSSVLKMYFAREESMKAGFAYDKAMQMFLSRPFDYIYVWLLSLGLLQLSIILPSLTILGFFFVPSIFFTAQILSALLYAQLGAFEPTEEATSQA